VSESKASTEMTNNIPPKNAPEIAHEFAQLRMASRQLRQISTETKNQALMKLASKVRQSEKLIRDANQLDLDGLEKETTAAFRDRLTLTPERIEHIALSLEAVAKLGEPVGEVVEDRKLENGLRLRRTRAPLGVILMIFESRPNVILEAFSLAFKSGNVIALRGGSDSAQTAKVIYQLMQETLADQGLGGCFYGFNNYDRQLIAALLKRKDWIDVVVPRGGDRLIEFVTSQALMPIIKNDRGMCHGFVDEDADLEMAVKIITNAKTSRPAVCNSLETVLVHEKIAGEFLPKLFAACEKFNVIWKCDNASEAALKSALKSEGKQLLQIEKASDTDWDTEHLDQILNCRIVNSLDEAIAHIETHGSRHSETIITRNETKARRFQSEIDAAAVYWNASTRFTDGFEFGLGGELGISTQKLHVRGPVGLRELTSTRWIIDGSGQIR
jgi:glutamate-5-semialdehyde dehydrogenase